MSKQSVKWNKTYKDKYPDKQKAKTAVANAIRLGKLKRLPCSQCSNVKSQAHHSDYTKPLEVVWLCQQCHTKQHHPTIGNKVVSGQQRSSIKISIVSDAMRLQQEGLTYRQIANELGTSAATVYKALNNTLYD